MTAFRRLRVYVKAEALATEVAGAVHRWDAFDRWTTGAQAVRAAESVCTNLAEGAGHYGHPDQRRFFVMARGSACELQSLLGLAAARELPLPDESAGRAEELVKMLNGLIRPKH